MKVLLVNAVCGSGSTGRICADIYDMLVTKGHEAVVAFAHGEPTRVPVENTHRINNRRGYFIHNVLARITDRAGFYSTSATKQFIEYIRFYKPDLIHLHNLHGFYINIRVFFEYLSTANIPVVWTLHDCWAFTGHCVHYSYIACNKWITHCHDCPSKKSYPQSLIFDQSRRNYNDKKKLFTSITKMHITTPSQWLAKQVKQSYLKNYDVTPIYNGIDLDIFKPTRSEIRSKYSIADSKTMLLAVANEWSARKGLADLIELNGKLDHSKFQLVIVGLNPKVISKLDDSIVGIQRTSSLEEIVKLYSAADVFLNPSYEETMGMVTAEALACGTPVIVYSKTAVPEIPDEKSGIVVNAGDVDAIYKAIPRALALNPDDCTHRAKEFEVKMQYNKYYKLYLDFLSK